MEMNAELTKQFTKQEVKIALKQMAPMKLPRLDNFNPSFYQTYWHIVGEEVTLVVLKFLNEGIFDNCINFTYIVHIPKIKCLVKTFDFKPTSLCNVFKSPH